MRRSRSVDVVSSRICRRPRSRFGTAAAALVGMLAAAFWIFAAVTSDAWPSTNDPFPTTTATKTATRTAAGSVPAIRGWITTADGSRRISPVAPAEIVAGTVPGATVVALDSSVAYQRIEGFGGALMESSVWVLSQLPKAQRDATLHALFDPATGAGLSYVRIGLGASDFALSSYTYDDLPAGETDPTLARFSLAHDDALIVPMLREILRINPKLSILASPWSAPAWMKDGGALGGGGLKRRYYGAYARYLVKTVKAYAARGIVLDALTVQNEPRYGDGNYPTMTLSPSDEATLIGSYVGPAFAQANIRTKILAYDHNWDDPQYAASVLSDPAAARYIAGTSWHCYSGDVIAQITVHDAFPDKSTYLTECSGRSWATDFGFNFRWNVEKILGAVVAWSRSAAMGNLALDPQRGPHVRGGCPDCRSVLTIDTATGTVTPNPEYDVLAEVSKVVRPGAVRVASPWDPSGLQTLAFVNPDGSHSLVLSNATSDRAVTITDASTTFTVTVAAGALVSYRW